VSANASERISERRVPVAVGRLPGARAPWGAWPPRIPETSDCLTSAYGASDPHSRKPPRSAIPQGLP